MPILSFQGLELRTWRFMVLVPKKGGTPFRNRIESPYNDTRNKGTPIYGLPDAALDRNPPKSQSKAEV